MSDTTLDHAQSSSPSATVPPLSTDHVVPLPLDQTATDSVTENSESTTNITTASTTQSPLASDSLSSHVTVPISTPSANKPQVSVAFSHAVVTSESEWGSLPPEVATADISIAPNGNFVETSSGPAARELKRRYDQLYGVGKDVRSPYMITAIINQHGKQVYRVGYRDATTPASPEDSTSQEVLVSGEGSRGRSNRGRPRMSVHNILSQSKAKTSTTSKPVHSQETTSPARKLIRRTRSIPDMFGVAASAAAGSSRQPTSTGRTHSHSVTGADMPRPSPAGFIPDVPKLPAGDIFSEAMQWPNGSVPPSPCASGSVSDPSQTGFIPYPFGPGLSFDSPTRHPDSNFLPMPRALREMQSFESGLTARAGDTLQRTDTPDLKLEAPPDSPHLDSPPPRLAVSPFLDDSNIPPPDPELVPLPETSMHSRYSPEVFDVLQTYRGLPLLDRLVLDSAGETTIRMSLRADDSAAPRDDPRFVLWGEMQASSEVDPDNVSLSQSSRTGMSSSSNSRRTKPSVDMPSVRISTDDPSSPNGSRRVLVAATIERWIAQLTSELNYDELLNFFLTYRTYISAVDLCHLLICRFHWSLSGHTTKQDEMVRKIVRVRTFVAIRYWLLTFFVMDFLPNRELRLLLASWLNTLVRDPVLKRHKDGLSIVRKLIKVVKDCKEAHTRRRRGSVSARQSISNPPKTRPTHVLGEKFAEATSANKDDSDVDLDFVPDDRVRMSVFFGNDEPGNVFSFGSTSGVSSPPRAGAITSASAAILQQPLQRSILQQSRASISVTPGTDPLAAPDPASITLPHNTLSRVFVKTIGRLGRWKRVLNSRQTVDTGIAVPANVSAFDLELSASGDLLTVRGGVEQYLKMIEPSSPATTAYASVGPDTLPPTLPSTETVATLANPQTEESKAPLSLPQHLRSVTEVTEEEQRTDTATTADRRESTRSSISAASRSIRTHSTESFGSVLSSKSRLNPLVAQVQAQPPWRFDVVSIDDLDLSDTSSEVHVDKPPMPPGLRKAPRKLPLRRDFEFVRRSRESVSSMGIRSRDSMASENSAVSVGGGLGPGIQQWQVNAIVDSLSDDEGDGGVEEALQRLEGQINPQRRKEKALKVDGWVRAIQERMAAGDFGDEHPRFYDDEDNEDDEEVEIDQHETGSVRRSVQVERDSLPPATASQITISEASEDYFGSATVGSSTAPTTATPTLEGSIGSSAPTSPLRGSEAKPAPEDAVPLEILQSRVPSRPSTSHGSPLAPPHVPHIASPPKMLAPTGRRSYRCWVLNVSADSLVQHFSMIDRELFLGIKPEELILDDWMSCVEVNVLDWAQYLKDRARWKAESRFSHKTSALAAVRGRFNLIANFVVSEIVLTHPGDRHTLVAKFIRIAIKAYSYSNFNTLAAILAGLRNEWVGKAMHRHWGRVGPWETQIFQKLSRFVNAEDDFKAMHQAITAMVDAKPLDVRSHASTVLSNSTSDSQSRRRSNDNNIPSACVPFIGVYLSQLYRYSKLPDLIDPTSPHTPVGLDSSTANLESPLHPEVFESLTPLPPSMQLEPLINVHKQRLIAGVIKELVSGQHLASRVNFPIDKKLFQRCLKIRGLDSGTLQQAYMMYCSAEVGTAGTHMRPGGFIPL